MVMATRILNLVSAVFILATGVYLVKTFADILSPTVQIAIGTVTITYFAVQLNRQVFRWLEPSRSRTSPVSREQFSS